jgi:glycosyltransferase involved in cell wall biosynthesis
MDVSVLICTIPKRRSMFDKLHTRLTYLTSNVSIKVELLYDDTLDITIGEKRNRLLERATGKYCGFIDDDDDVSDVYFTTYETAIRSGVDYDCVKLIGNYYLNGKLINPFYHSLAHTSWHEDTKGYYRCPNHLNLIKTDICRQIGYVSINFGEDKDFSERLANSGLLKSEYVHENVLYLYYKIQTPTKEKRKRLLLM